MPETAATASPDPVALRDWAARGLRIAELDGHSRGSAQALVQRAEGDLLHAWATVAPEQARVVFFYALMHRLVRAGLDAATPGMTRAPEPPETAAPADTAASPARAFAQRAAASRVARHLLDAALRALPASHRHAVLLRIWIDLDVIQVGQVMGLPSAEVKLALVGGLRGLRAGLGMAAPDGEPPADDGAWILRARDVLEDSVRGTEAVTDATSVTAAGHGDAADVRVADAQVAAAVMPAASLAVAAVAPSVSVAGAPISAPTQRAADSHVAASVPPQPIPVAADPALHDPVLAAPAPEDPGLEFGLDDDGEAWVMPPPKVTVIRNTGRNAGHAWDTQSLGSKQHVLAPAAPEPRAAAAGEPVRPSGARASVARVDGAQAREKVAEGSRDARKRDARAVEARRPDAIPADASAANLGPAASAVSIPRTSSSAYVWIGASVMLLGLAILLWQLWPAPAPLEANPAPQALPPSRPAYNPPPADTLLAAPDFDLLLDNDAPALLDDLAFYTWLHTTEALGPDTPDPDTPDARMQARNAQD